MEEGKKPDKKLDEILDSLKGNLESRKEKEVINLPRWPDHKRGAPNSFIRSALFAAIQGKDRRHINGEILASQDGITVKFTGMQLNQTDLAVWQAIVHLSRDEQLGMFSTFSAYEILQTLGLPNGLSQHKELYTTIIRLTGGVVQVSHQGRTFFGALIKYGVKDDLTGQYKIELNKGLIKLFDENLWTALDWQKRQEIKKNPIAQALHAFYSSHKEPFPMKIETIYSLVGSQNKQIKDFKYKLKLALTELVSIEFLKSFSIKKNMVYVDRNPNSIDSQNAE